MMMIIAQILTDVIPFDSNRPYDVRKVIQQVVDHDSFLEVQQDFAKNMVVGLARIKGEVIGLSVISQIDGRWT